jgi:hypothetical protein
MSWIMDNCPVTFVLCLENCVDLKDWDELLALRITNNSLMKIQESDLHRVFKSFKKTIVKLLNELEPFALNLILATDEQFVVSECDEFYDLSERVLQILLSHLKGVFLLCDESSQQVYRFLNVRNA